MQAKLPLVVQDAVVLARKVNALLHPSQAKGERQHSMRSVATSDLIQVLREYENERKSRTRLITVRSNLMGQALQIPFAPVSHFDSWQQHIYSVSVFYRPRVIWCIMHQVKRVSVLLLLLSVQTEWLCNSAIAQASYDSGECAAGLLFTELCCAEHLLPTSLPGSCQL